MGFRLSDVCGEVCVNFDDKDSIEGYFSFGRDFVKTNFDGESSDLAFVSRYHFIIDCKDEEHYSLRDVSKNGTYVNGKRVEKGKACELVDGDVIGFLGGKSSIPYLRFNV